jgi:hypothetical protein
MQNPANPTSRQHFQPTNLKGSPPMTEIENNHIGKEATSSAPDPFDLSNLRLSQSFTDTAGVKKLLTTVPVRKPNPQDWVRVHPDPQMRDNFPLIELKDEREEYVVAGALVSELVGEFVSKTLYTTVNRQGVVSLWPVRLPDPDGPGTMVRQSK